MLSRKARADSIPGLEILADDVRCTHGATVGKIDADQVFYLRSRGIPYREAERLIVEGFFDPIMQRIPFEGVRARFQDAIEEKMGNYESELRQACAAPYIRKSQLPRCIGRLAVGSSETVNYGSPFVF